LPDFSRYNISTRKFFYQISITIGNVIPIPNCRKMDLIVI
jgi:hypothetical protein